MQFKYMLMQEIDNYTDKNCQMMCTLQLTPLVTEPWIPLIRMLCDGDFQMLQLNTCVCMCLCVCVGGDESTVIYSTCFIYTDYGIQEQQLLALTNDTLQTA